ncbi:hypothetical protein ABE504_25065 [Paenibacillus oryzisoli]|uniref:hypothetical protein n=1 Tax=Paenibacillus oryzisoli TaxID=1850517 RepID=UPI003D27201B
MLSTRFFKRNKQRFITVMNVLLVLAVLTVQFAFGASSVKASNALLWNNLEPVATPSQSACSLSVSALNGVPYVAYCDENNQVWVKKYNGTGWDQLGEAAIGTAAADTALAGNKAVALYIDPANPAAVPYVAYTDTDYKLWVKKFNGSSWDTLGGGAVSGDGAAYINLYVSGGIPYVAYSDYHYDMKATAKAYDSVSDTWNALGSPGFTAKMAISHALSLQ